LSLFDYISIDPAFTLPDLPDEINQKGHYFQTKCTPSQAMRSFYVDASGFLYEKVDTYEYYENPDSPIGISSQLVSSKDVLRDDFTGSVVFYDAYGFPETEYRGLKFQQKYIQGWIEYRAKFVDGKLYGDIILIEDEKPYIRSDEEVEQIVKAAEERTKKFREEAVERRKKYPSHEQKALDTIYTLTDANKFAIPDIEDYSKALSEIRKTIEQYREEFDRFYE